MKFATRKPRADAHPWDGKNRWQAISIFAVLFTGYMMLTYLRKVFSFASPTIMRELDLDKSQLGLILSSQMSGYGLSKFVGGVLVDRTSSRVMLSAALLLSGLVTAGFAVCSSVTLFACLWFLNGVAQGPSWPACAVLIRRWFPADRFGTWWSFLSMAVNVSGTAGPIISTLLMSSFGWRYAMLCPGLLTMGLAVVALAYIRDHPASSDTKQDSDSEKKKEAEDKVGMLDLLQDRVLLGVCVNYGFVSLIRGGCMDWGQLFLIQERSQPQLMGSAFISSQEIGGFVGSFLAGIISDKLVSRGGWHYNPRLLVILWLTIGIAVSLHLLVFHITADSSKIFLSLLGFGIGFGVYGSIALFGVVAMEVAPEHKSGTAHAIVGLAGNVGVVISGLPLSLVAKVFDWHAVFLVLQAVSVLTVLKAYWCLRPSKLAKSQTDDLHLL